MPKNEFEEFLERAEQGLEEIDAVLAKFRECVAENKQLRKERKEIGIKPTSYIEMSDVDSCSYKRYRCGLCDSRISERDRFCRMCGKKIIW